MLKFDKEIHVRVSSRLYEALQEASRCTGASIAWLVRRQAQKFCQEKGLLKK